MPSSDNYFTGKNGLAQVDGTDLNITSWSVDPSADRIDVTNTGSGGTRNVIAGIRGVTFTIEMKWDAQNNPLDDPPSLYEGKTIENVKLFLDGPSSPFYLFPVAVVFGTPVSSNVTDATSITVNAESDGPYTRPTGDFSPQP